MFNLFKKPEVQKTTINSYPVEVLEIHNEFNTAADRLIEEANQILKEGEKKDFEKVDRLKSLGFIKANQVSELEPIRQKIELTKEQVQLINYYKVQYPFNKFITTEQVEQICKKYGLVYGDVSLYKGFVPEKNLKEIESFKLKTKDIPYLTVYDRQNNMIGTIPKKDCDDSLIGFFERSLDNLIYITESNGQRANYSFPVPHYEKYKHLPFVKGRKEKPSLKICAPLKDMDTTGMNLTNGFKLEKEIPDPVVLQPVNQGFLIVTMWADEQFDPFTEPMLRNDETNN